MELERVCVRDRDHGRPCLRCDRSRLDCLGVSPQYQNAIGGQEVLSCGVCGFFFFFSSRRRHTRYWRDWSSDVCSSDLRGAHRHPSRRGRHRGQLPLQGRGALAAVAKTRSRKGGSAVPLDEADRKLLNLLQGSFPLAERPYAEVARLAGLPEDEVLRRTRRLLDERIIREVTPIFDTRALGYKSMLVAAKVDPEHPWRAARIINSHPGVSHNYLRDHDFNLWFTIATEPGSMLGLDR